MLSKDTFMFKMDELLMTFPNWKIKYDDPNTMRFWYSKFSHMNEKQFVFMIDSYIENETFNPTIGGLKNYDTLPKKSHTQIEHEKMLKENGLL